MIRQIKSMILLLAVIAAWAGFRSYLDEAPFIESLDLVLSLALGELWGLVSTPTIFLALLTIYAGWLVRDYIV